MIKSKDIFLKEIANEPALQNNIVSLIFALNPNINIADRTKYFDNISSFYNQYKNSVRVHFDNNSFENDNELNQWYNRDLRIKQVKLKSVRGYPDTINPFGINFCNDQNEPLSHIILGGNGTGKSSLYSAIEYCYCQRIGEAELRIPSNYECSDNDKWFVDYLKNFNNDFNKSFCEVTTNTENLTFSIKELNNIPESVRKKINPDTHFISDFDIYSKGQLKYNIDEPGDSEKDTFHSTIAESLGLSELIEFEKNLKAFIYYSRRTETNRLSALKKDNEATLINIESTKKSIIEKRANIESLEKNQKEIPEEQNIKNTLSAVNQLKQTFVSFNFDYSSLVDSADKYLRTYNQYNSLNVKSGSIDELQFLNYGLELLRNSDNCPLCKNSNDTPQTIINNVQGRVNQINELNTITKELNQSFNVTIELLHNLFNQLIAFRGKINSEIDFIKDKVDFSDLLAYENKFFIYSSDYYGGDFFNIGKELESNQNFLKDKFSFLHQFILDYLETIKTDFKSFVKNIKTFIEKRESTISNIESHFVKRFQEKSIVEQIIRYKQEVSDAEKSLKDSEIKISSNNKEIEKIQYQVAFYEAIKQETTEYQKIYNIKLTKEVDTAFAPIRLVVEEILEYYFKEIDKRDVSIEIKKVADKFDEETGEVLSEIITAYAVPNDKSQSPLPVKKYLNTFHYRLFSTMVGIGVAIASRINTGINLPLVLDDIFYASDFENRATIEKFVKELFEIFNNYTPDKKLQLIFFTHDELLFESIIKTCIENNIQNVQFNKLYKFSEAQNVNDYSNLIFKLPHNIPISLTSYAL